VSLSSLTSSLSMLSGYCSGIEPSTHIRVTDRLTNSKAAIQTMHTNAWDLSMLVMWMSCTE
jgi:hypothetical protein